MWSKSKEENWRNEIEFSLILKKYLWNMRCSKQVIALTKANRNNLKPDT